MRRLLGTFTHLPLPEIDELCKAEGAALRDVKARLAFEATKLRDGEAVAEQARAAAQQAFGGGDDWSAVPEVQVDGAPMKLVDLVVHASVAAFKSKREARERIEGGGVRLDGTPITAPDHMVGAGVVRLQAGKKLRLRVTLS